MADGERMFSEKEIGEIVQRAAELQEQAPERGLRYTPGLSREQLDRLAQEVGVEPEFVQRALVEREAKSGRSGLFPEEERVVSGGLDPANFDVILEHVRVRRSRHRPATQIGRTLQARVWTGSGLANLEVTSRNDRTRLRLKPFPLAETLGTVYPAFIANLAAALPLATHGHPIAAALVAGGSMLAGVAGFFGWRHRSNRAVKRLADKLQGAIADEISGGGELEKEGRSEADDARRLAARRKQELK